LRFVTYLAPTLPLERIASRVGDELGVETTLMSDARSSGPQRDGRDPFSAGEADVGFLCAPPMLWLRERNPPAALA
jgi:hypothetical protein